MPIFDPNEYQAAPNGPLRRETISRLIAIKERSGLAYAALGERLGISGTFLHNLINKEANIGTQHVERIAKAIEQLENPDHASGDRPDEEGTLLHTFHLRPGLQVRIELPADLSAREADRLARFIQSLPVE